MLKVLNVVTDEKFIDSLIEIFDYFEKYHHEYLVLRNSLQPTFKHIKKTERVLQMTPLQATYYFERHNFDVVFIHNLIFTQTPFFLKLKPSVQICWFAWGMDIYGQPNYGGAFVNIENILGKDDKQYASTSVKDILLENAYTLYYNHLSYRKSLKAVMKRVNYFVGVLPNEYDLLRKYNKSIFNAEQLIFNYFNPNDLKTENDLGQTFFVGENVLVGNSATPTNNHLELLDILKETDTYNRKFIFPLSYGIEKYKDAVKEKANQVLGERFLPLNSFMSYDEYMATIQNCGYAIFNHVRQQGIGNLISALWNGNKVFLNPNSVAYRYYKGIGFRIYTTQDLLNKGLQNPMNKEDIIYNRQVFLKYYGKEASYNKVLKLLEYIEHNTHKK